MDIRLDDIKEFDFIQEMKTSTLAYYEGRMYDRKEAATQTASKKERDRLLSLAKEDEYRVDSLKERFMEEGIDIDQYNPAETEQIVNSLARHVTDPKQQKKEGQFFRNAFGEPSVASMEGMMSSWSCFFRFPRLTICKSTGNR